MLWQPYAPTFLTYCFPCLRLKSWTVRLLLTPNNCRAASPRSLTWDAPCKGWRSSCSPSSAWYVRICTAWQPLTEKGPHFLPYTESCTGSNLCCLWFALAESGAGRHLGRHRSALRGAAGTDPGAGWQHRGTAGWAPSWHGAPEHRIQDPHGYQDSAGARDRYVPTAPGRPGVPVRTFCSAS